MNPVIVELFRLSDDVPVPAYGTSLSACFDLSFQPTGRYSIQGYDKWNNEIDRMCYSGSIEILPGDRILVPTGLVMRIQESARGIPFHSIRLHARSGMSLKQGLVLANAEGVVDVDYQKEIFVMLTNISAVPATIKTGDRIAQAEVVTNKIVLFQLVDKQPESYSERDGGFGSTGHS